jgi:KDO2-lipid IV(A) lauroyltransferase
VSPQKVAAGATYGLYAGAWALVRRLPEESAYRLFELVADAVWRRQGRAVQRLEANLRRACPDLDPPGLRRLSREGMRSYLRGATSAREAAGWWRP